MKRFQSAEHSSTTEDYYAEVERYFVALRGSPLFITPREWQLIDRWREAQIPLRVVKQGLDLAFEKKKPHRTIRRLSYCRQTVEANFRRFREAIAGASAENGGSETSPAESLIAELDRALSSLGDRWRTKQPRLGEQLDLARERLARFGREPVDVGRLSELETELDRLDGIIVGAAEAALGESERQRCLDEAEASLKRYQGRMPEAVFRSALRSAYLKRVRAHFDLPALSLFYL